MDTRVAAKVGGWSAVVAGVTGMIGATVLLVVPPDAPADHFNYPLSPSWFAVVQILFCAHHLLLAFAFWAFGRARLAGEGRLAAISCGSTVALFGLFGAWEIVALAGTGLTPPSDVLTWIDIGYGTLSLLVAVALVAPGIAVARARVLTGWMRWITLAIGVYVFVPTLPALTAGFVIGRVVLGVWLLLFALLGWGMLRWAAHPRRSGRAVFQSVTT